MIKWYTCHKETGEVAYWSTQRDGSGVYYKIEYRLCGKYRLFINGDFNNYFDFSSLALAQRAVKERWVKHLRYEFGYRIGKDSPDTNWWTAWFDSREDAESKWGQAKDLGWPVTEIVEVEVA